MELVSFLALIFVIAGSVQKLQHHLRLSAQKLTRSSTMQGTTEYLACSLVNDW